MKKILFIIASIALSQFGNAQSLKTTVVEHFTNSNCGVCANVNPGIYTTLNNFPNAIHIAFHPSSPYSNCFFSLQNPIENDARTNFYNVYGGTPRLVVNGAISSAAALGSALQDASIEAAAYTIKVSQTLVSTDSVAVSVNIRKIASDANSQALLFVGVAEDTVFQATGNGETKHYDVFHKALTNVVGNTINLPTNITDSIVFNFAYKVAENWDVNRLESIAILQQNSDKKVLNAAKSDYPSLILSANSNIATIVPEVFPNPVSEILYFNNILDCKTIILTDVNGKIVKNYDANTSKIDVSDISNGIYFISFISHKNLTQSVKIKIQH